MDMRQQFLNKLISTNGDRLFYLCANDAKHNLPAWYFVFVRPSTEKVFEELPEGSSYDIRDYGNIIRSGWGKTAPTKVIEEMNRLYSCSFGN